MNTRKEKRIVTKAEKSGAARRVTTYILTSGCLALFATGFFFAAHQHFASMDYGMKNSKLRKQIDQLEAEKRRLMLAKEISLSPAEIKKAAKKVGMMNPMPVSNEVLTMAEPLRTRAVPESVTIEKALVTKTAAVAPVSGRIKAVFKKNFRTGREKTVLAQ